MASMYMTFIYAIGISLQLRCIIGMDLMGGGVDVEFVHINDVISMRCELCNTFFILSCES